MEAVAGLAVTSAGRGLRVALWLSAPPARTTAVLPAAARTAVPPALTAMVPVPGALRTLSRTVPPLTVTPPPKELLPPIVRTLLFNLVTLPLPEMMLATFTLSLRLKISDPLLVTFPLPRLPLVPPAPIWRLPAAIVVAP